MSKTLPAKLYLHWNLPIHILQTEQQISPESFNCAANYTISEDKNKAVYFSPSITGSANHQFHGCFFVFFSFPPGHCRYLKDSFPEDIFSLLSAFLSYPLHIICACCKVTASAGVSRNYTLFRKVNPRHDWMENLTAELFSTF